MATNDSIATNNPYYAWHVQDNWRLSRKLTLNLGLRFEYELGATERYNRVMGNFDYTAKLPISEAAQAAYAAKPIPELPASQFLIKGGSLYPGVGGTPRKLWKNSLQVLPRVGAAYQITPNMVVRAGYGLYYDTLNAMNQSFDRSFFDRTTSGIMTNDFGMNWLLGDHKNGVSPLKDPFQVRADGTRFDPPLRDALGLMARVGRGTTDYNFDRKHARQQRWRIGIQRQFGSSLLLDAAYAGSYSDNVMVSQTASALPQQYWADGLVRNDAIATNMNANVTNPFALANFAALQAGNPVLYNDMRTNSFFTSGTIRKERLLRPFPQMNGLNQQVPLGEVKTHEMILSAEKRFAAGFNFSVNYTRLSLQTADFFYNEFDAAPSWRPGQNGRPQVFNLLATYELPFGKGKRFATSGLPDYVLGGWQLSIIHQWWPGQLIDWGNLFYYGNLADIPSGRRDIEQWFNTPNFERDARKMPAAYHRRVFPTRVDGARADSTNDWSGNVQRRFKIRESLSMLFRFEVYNIQNRSQFWMPNTSPTSTDFGRVTSQPSHHSGQGGSVNRWIQLFARVEF